MTKVDYMFDTMCFSEPMLDEQAYLRNQSGTHLLDKFTHTLLCKCGQDVSIIRTLVKLLTSVVVLSDLHNVFIGQYFL